MAELRPSSPWWVVPVPLILAGTLGANHAGGRSDLVPALLLALVAASAAPAALLRPRTALLVNGLAVGAYLGAGLANGPILLSLPLTALAAAQRAGPRRLVPALAGALATAVLGLGVRVARDDTSLALAVWQAIGLVALGAAAAALGWWWVDRRRATEARAAHAATAERLRMAQDLHDGVGHGLAVIAMQAGVALHVLDRDLEQARASLEAIRQTSRESLDVLRAELARISGVEPGARRPAAGLDDLEALAARIRSGGLDVVLRLDRDDLAGLPDDVGRVVHAVVQESLTNVLRHARATRATVTVRRATAGGGRDRVEVTVLDDGEAAVAGPATRSTGLGIAGMRSRVEALGGELTAGPIPPSAGDGPRPGFRVRAVLPVTAGDRARVGPR